MREQFSTEAGEQKANIDRRSKFALARGGLTGGSVDRDTGVTLARDFQKGLLKGERLSQSALADLRASDERTRQSLIGLVQGGASATTAATSAANALSTNIAGARSNSAVDAIGDIFGNTREVFVQQEEAEARRRGLAESEIFASPFSRN